MGRWSQRRRRGGGGEGVLLTQIIEARVFDSEVLQVDFTFNADVDPGDFTGTDFLDVTSGAVGDGIGGPSSNVLRVQFTGGTTTAGDAWQYIGDTPGVLTPQAGTFV